MVCISVGRSMSCKGPGRGGGVVVVAMADLTSAPELLSRVE